MRVGTTSARVRVEWDILALLGRAGGAGGCFDVDVGAVGGDVGAGGFDGRVGSMLCAVAGVECLALGSVLYPQECAGRGGETRVTVQRATDEGTMKHATPNPRCSVPLANSRARTFVTMTPAAHADKELGLVFRSTLSRSQVVKRREKKEDIKR